MDRIEDGTDFFWQWVSTYASWIKETYDGDMPDALVGIANGANRLAMTMASTIGAKGYETQKVNAKTVKLTDVARFAIMQSVPKFVLVTEDVGTTGGTTSTVIPELLGLGVERVEVAHTYIRTPTLAALDALGVKYGAVIHDPLETFSEEDCRNLPGGFCNQGVLLIPHGK
jgi:orotate phosphoribosyltransferase